VNKSSPDEGVCTECAGLFMLRVEGLGIDNVGATANDQRVIGIGMGDEGNRRAENMRW